MDCDVGEESAVSPEVAVEGLVAFEGLLVLLVFPEVTVLVVVVGLVMLAPDAVWDVMLV